jgi:drug/metabolite transporter (DMT)-like permease
VWLVVAVAAVSTAAPLIRLAAAPALAVAFWRNALATGVLVPVAAGQRREWRAVGRREWRLAIVAGLLLALHFAVWIPSLSFTTVSSSVSLVATQPVWAAALARASGRPVAGRVWGGIAISLAGVVLITGAAVVSSARAVFGDVLALLGGMLAAAYVTVGAGVRRSVSTTLYTTVCYGCASLVLAAICVVTAQPLTGYPLRAWLCLAGLAGGAQLLGHSVLNRLLRTTSATAVSVAILGEIVGSSLLAWWWFGERPGAATLPAAVLIVFGIVLVASGDRPVEDLPG